MAEAPKTINLPECEKYIKQIRDVISVNIVCNDIGEIEEIHVLAEDSRNAKQISRDIETLFRVEYGVDLDHKKISIVQLRKDQKQLNGYRLRFTGIHFAINGKWVDVSVELASPKKQIAGKSSGLSSKNSRVRLIAEATVQAVNQFCDETCSVYLEDIALLPLGGRKVACASVAYLNGKGEESLVGCSEVKTDEKEAIVRAVLDALNRRLPSDI